MLEIIKPITLLLLPLAISALIIAIFYGKGNWLKERWTSAFILHPEKGLIEQGLLWFSMLVPFLYGTAAGIIIWSDYSLSLTPEGLSTFTKISVIPLALFSLSLPLTVLASRFHATAQTANQIKITKYKNNVDSFYSHRKELFGYFEKISDVDFLGSFTANYDIHPRIHKVLFTGKPADGTPQINEGAFKEIERDLDSARWMIDGIIRDSNPKITYSMYIANACSAIYHLSQKLGLREIYITLADKSTLAPVTLEDGSKDLLTVGTTTTDLIAAYRYAHSFFVNLCDFSGFEPSPIVNDRYKYILTGGSYISITNPPVIERLHREEIAQAIAEQQHKQFQSSIQKT